MSQCWKMQIITDKVTEHELQHCLEMLGIEVYQTHQHVQDGNVVADGVTAYLSVKYGPKEIFKDISDTLQEIHKGCKISTKWDRIGDRTLVYKTTNDELQSADESMPIRVIAVIENGVLTDAFASKGAKIQIELLNLNNMREWDDREHKQEMARSRRLDYETANPGKHDLESIL